MQDDRPHLEPYDLTGQVTFIDYIAKFSGNYSSVYLGALNGDHVAIKVVKAMPGQQDYVIKRKILREVTCWASTKHPNIFPFYGYANGEAFGQFGALISPWCSNGDATRYFSEYGEQMVMGERINLWQGVIEGVAYLHDQDPPIIHGDLKPGNILIDEFGKPRICDFGLARLFLDEGGTGLTTTSEHTGTARYLAPELVASDTTVYPTPASDVYALGCVGLVFIYGLQPFSNHPNNLRGQLYIDLRNGLPPVTAPPHGDWPSLRAWPLIEACWSLDPLYRPLAFTIAAMLRRGTFTLPQRVLQRIIHFVGAFHLYSGPRSPHLEEALWKGRTHALLNLCLVSKTCWEAANSLLYRDIRLTVDISIPRSRQKALMDTLDRSRTRPSTSSRTAGGYGASTEILVLCGPWNHAGVSQHLRDMVFAMCKLRMAVLCRPEDLHETPKLHHLTTLDIQDARALVIFTQDATLQALSCFQRLCADVSIPKNDPIVLPKLSKICLPNLQDIYIHHRPYRFHVDSIVASFPPWILPGLKFLHFGQMAPALVGLLKVNGALLQHVTIAHSEMEDTATIFRLCTNLRSTTIGTSADNPFVSLRHLSLEDISVRYAFYYELAKQQRYLGLARSLRSEMRTSFPKLRTVELNWTDGTIVSFHSGENSLMFKDHNGHVVKEWDPPSLPVQL